MGLIAALSALPLKADIERFGWNVCFGPKADIRPCGGYFSFWRAVRSLLRVDDAILKGLPRDVSKQIPKPCPDPHRKSV
jgi:hypothetical protein